MLRAGLSSSRFLADFDLRFVFVSIRVFFAFLVVLQRRFTLFDEDSPRYRNLKQELREETEISVASVSSCSKSVFSLRLGVFA